MPFGRERGAPLPGLNRNAGAISAPLIDDRNRESLPVQARPGVAAIDQRARERVGQKRLDAGQELGQFTHPCPGSCGLFEPPSLIHRIFPARRDGLLLGTIRIGFAPAPQVVILDQNRLGGTGHR